MRITFDTATDRALPFCEKLCSQLAQKDTCGDFCSSATFRVRFSRLGMKTKLINGSELERLFQQLPQVAAISWIASLVLKLAKALAEQRNLLPIDLKGWEESELDDP